MRGPREATQFHYVRFISRLRRLPGPVTKGLSVQPCPVDEALHVRNCRPSVL
jgi:hypothetical protein